MQIAGIVASLGMGLFQASREKEAHERAAEEQREIANRNAAREEMETREQVRRAEEEKRMAAARSKAGAGASGAMVHSASHSGYTAALEEAEQKKIDWMKKAGGSRADITRATGEMAAQTSEARGSAAWWGGVGSGVSSALSFL